MEEIKTVIDRLKDKLSKLDNENTNDLNSINDKQAKIKNLEDEINKLQNDIENRKNDMAKLEQKKAEAEQFDHSIEEVATLIDKEDIAQEKYEVAENKVEMPVIEEEVKEEVHEEKEEENNAEEVKEEEKEVAEEPIYPFGDITGNLETKDMPFNFERNMNDYSANEEVNNDNAKMDVPVFDEKGFDISASLNDANSIGLNEMYNNQVDNQSMMLR